MFDLKCSLTMEDFNDKVVFWDIDGVLAPYRFNGHVGVLESDNGMTQSEIDSGIFRERQPSRYMRSIVVASKARYHVVCSHVICGAEYTDKMVWLDKYYPTITKRLLIGTDVSKADEILNFCRFNKVSLSDVLFVDDRLDILREAEMKGISSWHVSSILDVLC